MITGVVLSDPHVGSAYGLFPGGFRLSNGSEAGLNLGQVYLLNCWEDFLERIPPTFDLLLLNGDLINGQNVKETGADLTEIDPEWQQRAAYQLLEPLATRAREVYATRGSNYHAGECGRWEEQLAERLGAVPDSWGHHAWDWLLLDVQGVHLDVAHHQSVVSRFVSMPLEREEQFATMVAPWKQGGSHLIIRSHVHRYSEVHVELQQSLSTAAWQLQTRFARMRTMPNRMFSRYIGGLWMELYPERVDTSDYAAAIHPVLYRHPDLARAQYVRLDT